MMHSERSPPHDRRRPIAFGPNNNAGRRRIGPAHMTARCASRRGQHSGADTPATHATGPQRQGFPNVLHPSRVRPEQPRYLCDRQVKMGAAEYSTTSLRFPPCPAGTQLQFPSLARSEAGRVGWVDIPDTAGRPMQMDAVTQRRRRDRQNGSFFVSDRNAYASLGPPALTAPPCPTCIYLVVYYAASIAVSHDGQKYTGILAPNLSPAEKSA